MDIKKVADFIFAFVVTALIVAFISVLTGIDAKEIPLSGVGRTDNLERIYRATEFIGQTIMVVFFLRACDVLDFA